MPQIFENNSKINIIEYSNDNMSPISLKEVASQIKASIQKVLKVA